MEEERIKFFLKKEAFKIEGQELFISTQLQGFGESEA